MPEDVSSSPDTPAPVAGERSVKLTPELVKQIAARVYALMLADIKIERERRRYYTRRIQNPGGGGNGA